MARSDPSAETKETLSLFPEPESAEDGGTPAPKPRKRAKAKKGPKAAKAASDKPPGVVDPRNKLNALTAREWIPETVSVWTQRGLGAKHPDAQIERQHPAPFSFTDVSRLVRFFSKPGEAVLDPFMGVGSTIKACAIEGRRGVGFELNPRYVALAQKRLEIEVHEPASDVEQRLLCGDARALVSDLETDSIDFLATSPPYWNILHKVDHKATQERTDQDLDTRYSEDDPRDLGNVESYDDFLVELTGILAGCTRVLKKKGYMAIVVSDFRHKSRFVMFHSDLAAALSPHRLELRGLKVLYQRHKRVFPYGYPYAYVPNMHHQFILILQNMKD